MRTILITLSLMISAISFAQNRVGINETELSTSRGEQPAFEFFIPDTDAQTVINAWNKFHKPFKVKPKQDKVQRNYYFTDNAMIADLSENTIDIYARIYETQGGVRFACSFDLGGVFISSRKTTEKFNKAKLLLNKFYAQMAMDAIIAEIEIELLELEKIRNEYIAINQEIAGFETQAATQKDEITKTQSEQSLVESDLDEKNDELARKNSELKLIKDQLKEIDKAGIVAELITKTSALKKVGLETTRIEKDINRKEAEIASLQAEINILKNDLTEKQDYTSQLQTSIAAIEEQLVVLNIEEKEDNARLLEQNINEIEVLASKLTTRQATNKRNLNNQELKLDKLEEALSVSKQTRAILEEKIEIQEAKLKELEDLKATIE